MGRGRPTGAEAPPHPGSLPEQGPQDCPELCVSCSFLSSPLDFRWRGQDPGRTGCVRVSWTAGSVRLRSFSTHLTMSVLTRTPWSAGLVLCQRLPGSVHLRRDVGHLCWRGGKTQSVTGLGTFPRPPSPEPVFPTPASGWCALTGTWPEADLGSLDSWPPGLLNKSTAKRRPPPIGSSRARAPHSEAGLGRGSCLSLGPLREGALGQPQGGPA